MTQEIIKPGTKTENLFKKAARELIDQCAKFAAIKTPEEFASAQQVFLALAGAIKKTKAHYDPKVSDAKTPYQNLLNERKSILEPLDDAKKALGERMGAYETEAKRIAAVKTQELEKQRQEENREQVEEQRIAKAEELQKAGKPEEALALLGEPITEAEQQAVFSPAPVVKPEIERASGVSKRVYWRARLKGSTDEEKQASLKELCRAIADGKVPTAAVLLNESYLNEEAKQRMKLFDLPGLESYELPSYSGRA